MRFAKGTLIAKGEASSADKKNSDEPPSEQIDNSLVAALVVAIEDSPMALTIAEARRQGDEMRDQDKLSSQLCQDP